jgi:hypothetical protein
VQRGLRHSPDFSWQQAAIETHAHAVYARVGAGAVPVPSLNDTHNGTARSGERRTDRRAAVGQAQHPLRKRARGWQVSFSSELV